MHNVSVYMVHFHNVGEMISGTSVTDLIKAGLNTGLTVGSISPERVGFPLLEKSEILVTHFLPVLAVCDEPPDSLFILPKII